MTNEKMNVIIFVMKIEQIKIVKKESTAAAAYKINNESQKFSTQNIRCCSNLTVNASPSSYSSSSKSSTSLYNNK